MHRLTGAKLTKLIDVQLLNRECLGSELLPGIKRRRILSQLLKRVKQEYFAGSLLS
jgi:hypothetical protein